MFPYLARVYTLLFLVSGCLLMSQTSPDEILPYSSGKVSKKNTGNAELLVKSITAGKTTDQEKFDAIFSWVTKNIKYDYKEFYTPLGSGPSNITRILKTRRTICLGYANLMDSLCSIAGISNVTVYGYAKDIFFDIGDTLYGHNHAWNAVRLDGLWYVYDATWSKGKITYAPTFWSRVIKNWLKKHPAKYKRKKLRGLGKLKLVCDEAYRGPVYYEKQRFFNRLFRGWLMRLPIRTRRVFKKGVTKDYYLSEPAAFSITHIPDDPLWNLGMKKSHRELVSDSAYYYFTDSTLKNQVRAGVECIDCDLYAQLSKKEKIKTIARNSYRFNKNNRFITASCEMELANINSKQSYNIRDTVLKIRFADSAQVAYLDAKSSYQQAKKNLAVATAMHKKKNKHKMSLLLNDNKKHVLFTKNQVKLSIKHGRNLHRVITQSKPYAKMYEKRAKKTARFHTKIKTDKLKPYPEKKLNGIVAAVNLRERKIDSLRLIIATKKQAYDSLLENLYLNIWPKVKQNDSMMIPFGQCANLRLQGKDNYKKAIIDIRKEIPYAEKRYGEELVYIIYDPSGKCYALFTEINKLINLRARFQNECLLYKREEFKAKTISHARLQECKEMIIKDCRDDYCWIAGNYLKVLSTRYGLKALKNRQEDVVYTIYAENDIERRDRHRKVNEAILEGYRNGNKSVSLTLSGINRSLPELLQYKRSLTKKYKRK